VLNPERKRMIGMTTEKPTFKELLRKHKIALGAVAAQAGVEMSRAYTMEQGGMIHGVYADALLAALSHLTGQKYTSDNVGGIYLHREYHDGPYPPLGIK
jgi:hypothetical protein